MQIIPHQISTPPPYRAKWFYTSEVEAAVMELKKSYPEYHFEKQETRGQFTIYVFNQNTGEYIGIIGD